jgi:hypothetical protein
MRNNAIIEAVYDSLSIEDLKAMIAQKQSNQSIKPMSELERYRFEVRQKLKAKFYK